MTMSIIKNAHPCNSDEQSVGGYRARARFGSREYRGKLIMSVKWHCMIYVTIAGKSHM